MKNFFLFLIILFTISCQEELSTPVPEVKGILSMKINGEYFTCKSMLLHLPSDTSNYFAFKGDYELGNIQLVSWDVPHEGSHMKVDLGEDNGTSFGIVYKGTFYQAHYMLGGGGSVLIDELTESSAKGSFTFCTAYNITKGDSLTIMNGYFNLIKE